MLVFVVLLLLGLLAAAFGSLLGLGGGIIIVPALIYLNPILFDGGMSDSLAIGTSMVILSFTALSSSLSYIKQKKVDFTSAWLLLFASGPSAIVGALFTQAFKPDALRLTFGLFIVVIIIIMVSRDYMKPLTIQWKITRRYVQANGQIHFFGYHVLSLLIVGCLVGFFSGLLGIGGGSLMVPAMIILFRYPLPMATATSMFVILMSSLLGSATHIVQGDVAWGILTPLALGALIGGWLGALLNSQMASKALTWILRVAFLLIAVDFIGSSLLW